MEGHGINEQTRWRQELDDIRLRHADWISSVLSVDHNTAEQQIENLIDTLMTWQQLCIQIFDTLEIHRRYVDETTMTDFDRADYAHTYSNAVHVFNSAGVDNHLRFGIKEHLVEKYD